MKSQVCLSLFVLLVCQGIFSSNQVEAQELTALDFEQIDFLFPLENIETSAKLSGADTLLISTNENGENGESGEDDESGSTDPGENIICYDTNCETCSNKDIGACTECKTGYEIVDGTCKTPVDPSAPVPKKTGKLSSKMRFEGTVDVNDEAAVKLLKLLFKNKFAIAMKLDSSQVDVTKISSGSIIVAFDLYTLSSSTLTVAELKGALDTLAKNKDPSLDVFGTGIMDYYGSSIVVSEGGCPAGYYADADSVCQACEEGCTYCESDGKCGKANIGAIVGGVLGGLALIMLLIVAYVKKDVLFKGSSSPKSPNRAAYYAAGSPVSPTEQAHLKTENQA